MNTFDLEGANAGKRTLRARLSSLWQAITGQQRFQRLPDTEDDVEKASVVAKPERPTGLRWCPEEEAGLLSSLTYHFVTGRQLLPCCLPSPSSCRAEQLVVLQA